MPTSKLVKFFECDICSNGEYSTCIACYNQQKCCKDAEHILTLTNSTTLRCRYTTRIIEELEAFTHSGDGDWYCRLSDTCTRRSLLHISGQLKGLGPRTTRNGDLVVVLFGFRVPFVLRSHKNGY
jgi:hypothetical protein